jgi:hypothetical protein
MNKDKRAIVTEALNEAITANGVRLSEKFTAIEIADIANTVVAYLPFDAIEYVNYVREHIHKQVYTDKEVDEVIFPKITKDVAKLIKVKKNLDLDIIYQLIYNLIHLALNKASVSTVETNLHDLADFELSHIITNGNKLPEEITHNPVTGTTIKIEAGYVRLDSNKNLIPTIQTQEEYKSKLNL